jgi:signal transduction histidine kinase
VRLLTYSVPPERSGDGVTLPAALQLGRLLSDQDRVLNTLLAVLLTLGGMSAVMLAAASWWLAGRALRPAQLAWDRQQAFVANASHELRAPLTLMRASAEVAMRSLPPGSTELHSLLTDMVTESDHMSRLVEDLLLLSRIDAGRLQLELRPVQVQQMLNDIQRQARGLAVERGITLTVASAQCAAQADATRLRQVLLIILDNALRHTPRGGHIKMEAQPMGKFAQISVSDTGSGIAPEHVPHIFERFYRASSVPGADAGSGLGLSIAKALMEAQRGQISVQSSPGKGTTVALLLPAAEEGINA